MKITADQLKAIEQAIGRDAVASVNIPSYFYPQVGPVLEVHVRIKREDLHMRVCISDTAPIEIVARHLVDKVNAEIASRAFGEVRW